MNKHEYKISIIIPSRNRLDTLPRVLLALEQQDYPKNFFEVVVVDDKSSDGTREFLKDFAKQTNLNFSWVEGVARNAGAARNIGLRTATGVLALFLDSDTIPEHDLVSQHLLWHNHFGSDVCILGRVSMSDKLVLKNQGRVNDTLMKHDDNQIVELKWSDYRTANTSLSREDCLLTGGFDETLPAAEDTEIASRLAEIGVRFIYVRDINVIHHHPLSNDGFFYKGELYGQAAARWYKKNPKLRRMIIARYGVFAPEMQKRKKAKYVVRALLVNRLTVPVITLLGRKIRRAWFDLSDAMNKCVFRYYVRQSFRSNLRRI